jgi:hypothetical protein
MFGLWHWFLTVTGSNNTSGIWYGFWSGFGSDLGEVVLIGGLIQIYRGTRCHVDERATGGKNCRRRGRFPFQHYKLCKIHHPNVPQNVTHLHIMKLHKEQQKSKVL